jgi:NADPH2:quinone reductase
MMRAIPFMKKCSAKALKVRPWPKPVLHRSNDVLIEVKAFGLNFADILARNGMYRDAPPFPFIPGYEAAGRVVEVGPAVQGLAVGDDVMAFCSFGGYAEYVCTPAEGVWKIPQGLSYSVAAAIPVQYATAWHCLFETGRIREGDRVLIHACAGGVGQACVELIRATIPNVIIIGTCGSSNKVELLKQMGVDHAINYTTHDYQEEIQRLYPPTVGEDGVRSKCGVDVILNSLGGDSIKKDMEILRPGGRVVAFGVAHLSNASIWSLFSLVGNALSMLTMNAIEMMTASKSLCAVNMKQIGDHQPNVLRDDMDQVLALVASGRVKVKVSVERDWNDIADVQTMLESRQSTGKLVLLVTPPSSSQSPPHSSSPQNPPSPQHDNEVIPPAEAHDQEGDAADPKAQEAQQQ